MALTGLVTAKPTCGEPSEAGIQVPLCSNKIGTPDGRNLPIKNLLKAEIAEFHHSELEGAMETPQPRPQWLSVTSQQLTSSGVRGGAQQIAVEDVLHQG